jgi:glycine/D-amino acid oxidase-like deaminating enzyme
MKNYNFFTFIATMTLAFVFSQQALSQKQFNYTKKPVQIKTDRFVIIGAGISGIATARSLISKGVSPRHITIIEGNEVAGGKVSTQVIDGKPYELGAQIIIPGSYKVIEDLALELGIRTTDLQRGFFFDTTSGKTQPFFRSEEVPELIRQIEMYLRLYKEKWHQADLKSNFRLLDYDGLTKVHPDLEMPWAQFVKINNFELIERAFITILGGAGELFESYNSRNAARIVRALRPDVIQSVLIDRKPVQVFLDDGFQGLLVAASEKLRLSGVSFRFSTSVEKIYPSRGDRMITLKVVKGLSTTNIWADHIIYTANPKFLPTIVSDFEKMGLDLYANVTYADYRAFLVRVKGVAALENISGSSGLLPNILQGNYELSGNETFATGLPVLMVKPYKDSDIVTIYAHGSKGDTNEGISKKILEIFRTLNGTAEIIKAQNWNYRPKFKADETENLKKAALIQGLGGVWVTGEIFSFGAVHNVYETAQGLVQKMVE